MFSFSPVLYITMLSNAECQCTLPDGMKNCKNLPAKMEIDFIRLYQVPSFQISLESLPVCLFVCLSLMLKSIIKFIWSISTFQIFFRNLSSHFIEFYFLSFLEVTIAFLHVLFSCAFFMCFFIVCNTPFRIRRMSHTVWDVQRNSIQPKSLY